MNSLKPTYFIDFDHPDVEAYAQNHTAGATSLQEKTVALFYRIRDEFSYWPYNIDLRPHALKASYTLKSKKAYCAQKALLMVACCRSIGVEANLQFFNVRNHLGIGNLQTFTQTDVLVFHTGLQVKLNNQWLKVLPAFDAKLCEKLKVKPIEFDGMADAFVQEYEGDGRSEKLFMEYIHDYGCFDDLPLPLLMKELNHYYPHIFSQEKPALSAEKGALSFIANWDESYLGLTDK